MFQFVALDADDTLWHNGSLFTTTLAQFRELLRHHHGVEVDAKRFYEIETRNLEHFGYSVKGFTLSMIETAIELTDGRVTGREIQKLMDLGREMLQAPVKLLDGVEETVKVLAARHPLMLLTKGDLFDQESKLARSGLGDYFSVIEIVSEKDVPTYHAVMSRHDVAPDRFVMVGNSLRSDVLPALEVGARAVHIPYQTTWLHDRVPDDALQGKAFVRLESIRELPAWLERTGLG